MAKSSKKNLQDDRRKILNELRKNARESLNTLAEKLNFSRQKVWRTIAELEKEKKIWGYTAVVDDSAFDYKQYIVLIKRSSKPASEIVMKKISSREVKNRLAESDIIVLGSYYVHGAYDWVITVNARNINQIKNAVEFFYNQLQDLISDVKILEVLFPLEKSGIENPNSEEIKEFF